MKQSLILAIVAFMLVTGFVAWRVYAMRHVSVVQIAVAYDPSLSYTGGCASLVGGTAAALRSPGVSANSTLSVLALGDEATAYQPRRLAVYQAPSGGRILKGNGAVDTQRAGILSDVRTRCEALAPTEVSPIFLGVQQALALLHAKGCKAKSHCRLWVATDLEETVNTSLVSALSIGHAVPRPNPVLDNRGVSIIFCGYADTRGRDVGGAIARDPTRDERFETVWRGFFMQQRAVRFAPYCPQAPVMSRRQNKSQTR